MLVMRCKGGSPYCGADGYCHAGGTCFADQELTREQAILEVDRLAQELHNSKIENDKLRNAASQLVSQLELAKEQNLKNGNDQKSICFVVLLVSMKSRKRWGDQ
ncbi:hypothetical protein [Acinetobacter phage Ab69]|nr:hypothetical protein [Acinetobacter phage Ab69]